MGKDVSLRDYQIADLAFYIHKKKCLNLSDPGVGKTPSVCVMQWYLWDKLGVGTAFVMPKSLLKKNRDEILRFTHFKPEDVIIVDGKAIDPRGKVFLMGFDRYARCWKDLPTHVKAVHVDEIHKGFKSDTSQRTQAFYQSMKTKDWFIGMTGTLVNGRLDSAYPAIRVIEPRYYPSYQSFYHYHAVIDLFTGKLTGWRNHEKIAEIFGRHAIRRTFDMVYGKEAKVIVPEFVSMTKAQRELYDKFEKDALLDLEKFYLDGTQPGTAFIRARQIMEHPNAFPNLAGEGTVDIMPGARCGKIEAMDIHFEDHASTGKPIIVYAALRSQQTELAELATSYGLKVSVLNGSVSQKRRGEIDEAFRRGDLNCIVGSPQVADVGFNWQFCGKQEVDHLVFASLDFLDTTVLQAYRRAIRGKRSSPLRISVLLYEKSLDQRITWIIYQKSRDANMVDPTQPVLRLDQFNADVLGTVKV